jgi:hypothetical protein
VILFQQADVEDIMERGSHRQLKLMGDAADMSEYLERPEEARAELAAPLNGERRDRAMQEAQPDPIADLKLDVAMLAVVVQLVVLLRLLQPVANFRQELISGGQLLMHGRKARFPLCIGPNRRGVAAIDHLER